MATTIKIKIDDDPRFLAFERRRLEALMRMAARTRQRQQELRQRGAPNDYLSAEISAIEWAVRILRGDHQISLGAAISAQRRSRLC